MTTLSDLQKTAAENICARFPQVSRKEFRGDFTLTVQPDDLTDVMGL